MANERPKTECSAFCPQCGSDLFFLDGVCFCKNAACAYKCEGCKQEKEKLFFGDGENAPGGAGAKAAAESRCGLLCGECEYREQVNCGGCTAIEKPFWGDACPVKSCCEGRKLEFCGACGDFPCDLLNQFSYDKEQGDGGKRIQQCRIWRQPV